jgi:hypothetical protein
MPDPVDDDLGELVVSRGRDERGSATPMPVVEDA